MVDIFVSYSHKPADATLAESLVTRLESRIVPGRETNLDCWIDRENIEYATDWRARIMLGIESCSHLLVILSNNYLASEVCNEELQYARDLSKPIIVVCEEFPSLEEVGLLLEKRPWERLDSNKVREVSNFLFAINFIRTSIDKLDTSVEQIFSAYCQNIPYTDGLTHWSNRQLLWTRRNYSDHSLLAGDDLTSGEQWRAQANIDRLRVPEAIDHFLRLSRKHHEENRARWRLRIIMGLVTLSVLGVIAIVQFIRAENENAIAKQQESVARSRQLANFATSNIDADPSLAALLAIEALKITEELPEAVRVLSTIVDAQVIELGNVYIDNTLQVLVENNHTALVAWVGGAKKIIRPDESGRISNRSPIETVEIAMHPQDVMLSPNLLYVAQYIREENSLYVSVLNSNNEPKLLATSFHGLPEIHWSHDSSKILAGPFLNENAKSYVMLFESDDNFQTIRSESILIGPEFVTNIDWSWDDQYAVIDLAHIQSPSNSVIIDIQQRKLLDWADLDGNLPSSRQSSWSPVRSLLKASNAVYDMSTGGLLYNLEESSTAAWSSNGELLATLRSDNTVAVRDAKTGEIISTLDGADREISQLIWSHDGSRIAGMPLYENSVIVWDVASQRVLSDYLLYNSDSAVAAAWTENSSQFLVATRGGRIYAFNYWDSVSELILEAQICCIKRSLNEEERKRYGLNQPSATSSEIIQLNQLFVGVQNLEAKKELQFEVLEMSTLRIETLGQVRVTLFREDEELSETEWSQGAQPGWYRLIVEAAPTSNLSDTVSYGLFVSTSNIDPNSNILSIDVPISGATSTSEYFITPIGTGKLYFHFYSGGTVKPIVFLPNGRQVTCNIINEDIPGSVIVTDLANGAPYRLLGQSLRSEHQRFLLAINRYTNVPILSPDTIRDTGLLTGYCSPIESE